MRFVRLSFLGWGGCLASLPITAEIDAGLVPHRQRHDSVNLDAVRFLPVILAPRSFLGEAYQIRAGKMMMVADFGSTHPAEKRFGVVAVDGAVASAAFRAGLAIPDGRQASVKAPPGISRSHGGDAASRRRRGLGAGEGFALRSSSFYPMRDKETHMLALRTSRPKQQGLAREASGGSAQPNTDLPS
jgi:hypothetical protein